MSTVESEKFAKSAAIDVFHAASVSELSKVGIRVRQMTVARLPRAFNADCPVVMCAASAAVIGHSHTTSPKSTVEFASAMNAASISAPTGAGANVRHFTTSPAANAPATGAGLVVVLVASAFA